MKFFIDTANLEEIREAKELGLIDGVTTNPTLVAKEGCSNREDFKKLVHQICEVVQGPVSAEVVSTDVNGMVNEARELAEIHQHVVVKIPMITDGLKATRQLADAGIKKKPGCLGKISLCRSREWTPGFAHTVRKGKWC